MTLTTLLAFAFVLGVVVVVHESGHFFVAKAVGIYCKTFSVGFGPKLLRRRYGETEYAISAIPFGGYVKMAGEGVMEDIQDAGTGGDGSQDLDADGQPIPPARYFSSKSTWQRMAVVVAGPLMNLVLALVVCIGVVWIKGVPTHPITTVGTVDEITTVGTVDEEGPAAAAGIVDGDTIERVAGQPVTTWEETMDAVLAEAQAGRLPMRIDLIHDGQPQTVQYTPVRDDEDGRWDLGMWYRQDTRVGRVRKGGPADRAGLQHGDRIVSIDGKEVKTFSEIADIVNNSIDTPLQITWMRGDREITATVTPVADEVPVSLKETKTVGLIYYEPYVENQRHGLAWAVGRGSDVTWGMVSQTAGFLKTLVSGGASKDSVSGPLRIAQFSGQMAAWGFDRLLLFLSLFSVNLFLLNLLPVPVLDGGHAMFILYEMVLGRRPNQRVQMMATQVGFVALLLLMAWVITMDVLHVVS
jgi:regulator of sigma E protease